MKPSEMTTVELMTFVAEAFRIDDTGIAAALLSRAERLANVLKVAGQTGDPKEPFDNGRAAMFAAYELARQLNAPSALLGLEARLRAGSEAAGKAQENQALQRGEGKQ